MQEIGILERNKSIYIIALFGISSFFNVSVASQKLEQHLHKKVLEGIHKILLQDYENALRHFINLAEEYPQHPVGYLYQVAVLETRAMDLEFATDDRVFDSLLTIVRKLSKQYPSPWKEYFLATADGYVAYRAADKGDWLKAISYGSSSATLYEDALKKDSSFYDAYVGLGTYYFWRSQKTGFLHWLPFISDDREKGKKMIEKGAECAEFNRFTAMSSLISIYIETSEYEKAEKWAREALQHYPKNRIFLWGLATALDRQHRYSEASNAYKELLSHICAVESAHPYNEIVCRLNYVKTKLACNDTNDVRINLQFILNYRNFKFPSKYSERAKKKFEEAEKLLIR